MVSAKWTQQLIGWSLAAAVLAGCGAPAGYSAAPAAASESVAYGAPSAAQEVEQSEEAADMYFQDYGVNGFVTTAQDHLSTFAVDVDTGAYTLMRSYLNDSTLPPAEAIRIEEMINYFDYHYAYPTAADTFGIAIDAAPSPFVAEPNHRMVRIGIQGYGIPASERKNVALTFVIDVSGSMDMENRLGLAKRSLSLLVEALRPTDAVAIVIYGSQARTILPMTSAADKATIIDAIGSLTPDGSTNAEEGLRVGYELAWRAYNPAAINRVVLVSDGVANVGQTGPEAILESIAQYAAQGITMTSVGVGMGNYNDLLMEQLADKGDGFYAYVDDIEEARRLFVDDLTSTLQAIAKDAKVQVEFNPATVSSYRLVGYENRDVADADFRNDEVDAGEIGAGHSVTALYEVVLQEGVQESQANLATVHLRWQDLASGEVKETSHSLALADVVNRFADSAPSLQLAVTVAEYGEILRHSDAGADTTLEQVLTEAKRINALLTDTHGADGDVTELVDLLWRADQLTSD